MHRVVWIMLSIAVPPPAHTIDIGPMTATMEPSNTLMTRTVTNNNEDPKVYDVQLEKISNPTAMGHTLTTIPGELLFAPARFVLHAKQAQNVKFYYKGPADPQERYYRVIFTESPVAQVDEGKRPQTRGTAEMKVALHSILVVRPRQLHFEYRLNQPESKITNTGNTYFEFMVKQGCEQPDSEADSKYLLPGETYQNPKISQTGNQKLIVYQSRFIPVGKDCWPNNNK